MILKANYYWLKDEWHIVPALSILLEKNKTYDYLSFNFGFLKLILYFDIKFNK